MLYSGTDKTNLFIAKFWNEYFSFAGVTDFDATNSQISNFKVFFNRDSNGAITSEAADVYLQLGSSRSIYFSNGTIVTKQHYSSYVDATTKQLVAP